MKSSIMEKCLKAVSHLDEDVAHLILLAVVVEEVNSVFEELAVILGERHIADGVVWFGVAIVYAIVHLNWRIVTELVGTHDLEVALYGSQGYTLGYSLHFVEGFGACLGEVVDGPTTVSVPQAAVYGLVAD